MKLSDLIDGYGHDVLQGDPDLVDVRAGIAYSSHKMTAGSLYVAMRGTRADGHQYVHEAVERGAVAVLVERPVGPLPPHVCVIRVADTRAAVPTLASRYFGHPARELNVIAVTGTNGKTSVSYMVEALLRTAAMERVGVIGTDGYRVADEPIRVDKTTPTTPESVDLHHIMRCMRDRGAGTVVMEASSIALTLHRVDESDIDVGIFTNLTPDHLDSHGDMDSYRLAKLRLFNGMCRHAVANADDGVTGDIMALMPAATTTFGIDSEADFRASGLVVAPAGTRFNLTYPGGRCEGYLPIPGRWAVYNALAALAACHHLGYPVPGPGKALGDRPPIPGRFETIRIPGGVTVVIDYAHSPDSLEQILTTIQGFTGVKDVITVFGCGGDRDVTKRAPMGEIAGRRSSYVVVTSDNPRSEDPEAIIDQIVAGVETTGVQYTRIADRRAAITRALAVARPGDVVLLAGKGAETYQIIGGETVHFSDSETVRELAANWPAT